MRRVGRRHRQEPACGGDWGWWLGASGSRGLQQGERALHPDLEALSQSWGCRGALVVGRAGLVQGPWQTLAHCAPHCRSPGCPSRPPECAAWDAAHPPDRNLVHGRRLSSLEARPALSGISCPSPHPAGTPAQDGRGPLYPHCPLPWGPPCSIQTAELLCSSATARSPPGVATPTLHTRHCLESLGLGRCLVITMVTELTPWAHVSMRESSSHGGCGFRNRLCDLLGIPVANRGWALDVCTESIADEPFLWGYGLVAGRGARRWAVRVRAEAGG